MCQDTWDERDDYNDQDDDDRYDEYKDDLAMGRIWPDGSYREPDFDGPDPWDRISGPRWERLRERLFWARVDLRRWMRRLRHRKPYSDEPPF
jgi:hypothetical protein